MSGGEPTAGKKRAFSQLPRGKRPGPVTPMLPGMRSAKATFKVGGSKDGERRGGGWHRNGPRQSHGDPNDPNRSTGDGFTVPARPWQCQARQPTKFRRSLLQARLLKIARLEFGIEANVAKIIRADQRAVFTLEDGTDLQPVLDVHVDRAL